MVYAAGSRALDASRSRVAGLDNADDAVIGQPLANHDGSPAFRLVRDTLRAGFANLNATRTRYDASASPKQRY